jgi:hypothetical protein
MQRVLAVLTALFLCASAAPLYAADAVPAGKEKLVIDYMSKAREAAGKKAIKGPVPFAHQAHVDSGVQCASCHHKLTEGEPVQPCHECHKAKKEGKAPKLSDAFHGGEVKSSPSLHSCIGCHRRDVYEKKASTTAPYERKPCEACHSLKKK